jgi:hypothetical protein
MTDPGAYTNLAINNKSQTRTGTWPGDIAVAVAVAVENNEPLAGCPIVPMKMRLQQKIGEKKMEWAI